MRYNLKISFSVAILILFISSCAKKKVNTDFGEDIQNYMSYFSSKPFSFYSPEYYDEKHFAGIINPSALYAKGYSTMYFKNKVINKGSFDSITSNLEAQSLFKGSALDTSNFFIPNFKLENPEGKYPILSLNNPLYTIKDSLDMAKSSILIFKNESGQFFNEIGEAKVRKYADIDDSFIIGKGYSNGAIIDYSSKEIIYWVLIW